MHLAGWRIFTFLSSIEAVIEEPAGWHIFVLLFFNDVIEAMNAKRAPGCGGEMVNLARAQTNATLSRVISMITGACALHISLKSRTI